MESTAAYEYFLELLDEGVRILRGDSLAERSEIVSYEIKEPEKPVLNRKPLFEEEENILDASNCHDCPLFRNRRVYAEPLYTDNATIMFIVPCPDGDTLFSPPAYEYFTKWYKAITLERKDIALTSLIKCPTSRFSASDADCCKRRVKGEMDYLKPKAMVLLGEEAARYMLRKSEPFDRLRRKKWVVNHIPVYCTYHPEELVKDRRLAKEIWQDLQFIAESIGINKP